MKQLLGVSPKRGLKRLAWGTIMALVVTAVLLTAVGCREVAARLDKYLQRAVDAWHFSGTVLVAVDGQVVLAKGYGWANVVFEEPNTPTTKFYIGSITKTFTAAAIMKLHERGEIALDAPLTRYLPDYPSDPGDRITVSELLSHTSGIPNYTDHPEINFKREQPMTPVELIDFFKGRPLLFEPGTQFSYSNSNFVLLGEIIEAVSGQSYEAFLHHEILKPLGMLDSGYGRREAAHPELADGYTLDQDHDYVEAVPVHLSVLYAAGALYSTAEDLLKWDQGLYGNKILSQESIDDMFAPRAHGYGYGWAIDSLYGRRLVYHGGFLDGFNCTMDRWLDDRLCIIVLSNEDLAPVKKIARSLAAICFGEPYSEPRLKTPAVIPGEALGDYVGAYQVCPGAFRFITLSDGALYAQVGNAPPERLWPEARDIFYFNDDNTRTLTFVRGADGRMESQILFDNERRFQADRIQLGPASEPVPPRVHLADSLLNSCCGVYDLESDLPVDDPNYKLHVSRDDGRLLIALGNSTPIPIIPRGHDQFWGDTNDYLVIFQRDSTGNVVSCLLQMGESRVRGYKEK